MSLLKKINKSISGTDNHSFLSNPGDEARLRVTKSGRKVATLRTGDGKYKYSKTEYSSGTVVETKTTKK